MLFFIRHTYSCLRDSYTFKYISCYSLSKMKEDHRRAIGNLNTSHVILYLLRQLKSI